MKKTILSIVVVMGALMAGQAASAQAPAQSVPAQSQAAQGRQSRQVYNPFEGLNLSEQQLADLKALADAKKEKMKQQQEEAKNQQKEGKAPDMQERKAQAEAQLQERKDELAKIKAILTPEQYVQYLENAYLNLYNNRDFAGRRDMRQGNRNMRGDRMPGGERRGGERRGGGERN
ncbi:MAG: hypothetical protein K2K72_05210 [Duncaniella sp.]|nr:hypothetical protein [Duncaniella sp.]